MNRLKKFLLITALSLSLTMIVSSIYASESDVASIWREDPVQRLLDNRDDIVRGEPQVYTAERLAGKIRAYHERNDNEYTLPYDENLMEPITIGEAETGGKVEGKVVSVDPITGTIIVEKGDGSSSIIRVGRGTSISKDGRDGTLRDIEKSDYLYAQLSPNDLSWSIKVETPASQKPAGDSEGGSLLDRLMAEGLLTADQLNALALGDLEGATEGLKRNVYNRLITDGVDPAEAEAIITQDWGSLAKFSKTRLAAAISEELGISKEMVIALMNQDWKNARAYAQIEAANYLISYLLKTTT